MKYYANNIKIKINFHIQQSYWLPRATKLHQSNYSSRYRLINIQIYINTIFQI